MRATIDTGEPHLGMLDVETALNVLMEELEAAGRFAAFYAVAHAAWNLKQMADVESWTVLIDGEQRAVTGLNYTTKTIST